MRCCHKFRRNRVVPPRVSPKSELRAHIRSVRRAMPDLERTTADRSLAAAASDLVRQAGARTVSAYVPLAGEPGGGELVPALAGAAERLLLPVLLDDNDLDWAEHDGSFAPGRFGLLQPTGPRLGREAVAGADLVLLPGLAVSPDGTRLGQGGGSYDRVLQRVEAPTVVLLYPGEFLADVPSEPHDQHVCGAIEASAERYETAHVHWTKGCSMTQHWHSKYRSANDGG
ncbi:5-formyltetrahydrofolate cyclo-ligase [Dactylosporangium darangshiense]|uniref:5-formyltetrahydrofolate cyclo-ligase n=1 Tax=Dactylosporangium darangshiense TaxID=579108 RepID=UPI0031EE929E